MNVLVTGGAGYLGSTLVPLLLSGGHRVRVLDSLLYGGYSLLGVWTHAGFELIRADIRDATSGHRALEDIEAVVHLAAIVGDPACARQPELARSVNLEASLALLEASRQRGVGRFVFASTCSNYGRMADPNQLVDESAPLRPLSLYAQTKVQVEQDVLDPRQRDGLCATSLRFATLYGVSPRMRFDLTVNEFALELLTKGHLVVFGEQFWRPYVHVLDAARATALVLDSPADKLRGEVFNVGSTAENYQKAQLVELIRPLVEGARIEFVHRQEDPRDYRVSFEKIARQLGFRTTRTVRDGIREVASLVRASVLPDGSAPAYRN